MKKISLALAFIAISILGANAQKGNNQIGVGVDIGIPTGDFGDLAKLGFGGYVKGLLGIGTAGQVTLTSGYTSYGLKDVQGSGIDKASVNIIPILLGYRHNFSGFYVEPQAGYGIFGAKIKSGGVSASSSDGAFTWALGLGYVISNFDIAARYESMHKDGESNALVGIHIGYNFSLGGSADKK